jgi:hypothetical protein
MPVHWPSPPLELPDDRPLLLLDVDGVINVFQCSDIPERKPVRQLPPMRVREDVKQWLSRLDEAFYIVWCSHWGRLINRFGPEVWGLGHRPYLEEAVSDARASDWKLRSVIRSLGEWQGPLAWVEDGFGTDAMNWAVQRTRERAPTRLVDVTEAGMTEELVGELLGWARSCRPEAGQGDDTL